MRFNSIVNTVKIKYLKTNKTLQLCVYDIILIDSFTKLFCRHALFLHAYYHLLVSFFKYFVNIQRIWILISESLNFFFYFYLYCNKIELYQLYTCLIEAYKISYVKRDAKIGSKKIKLSFLPSTYKSFFQGQIVLLWKMQNI